MKRVFLIIAFFAMLKAQVAVLETNYGNIELKMFKKSPLLQLKILQIILKKDTTMEQIFSQEVH